jgi:L-alanine-DL-glutamate epimerase-like enolase superfamily enzyme
VPIPKWSYETLETVTTTLRHYFRPVLLGHPVFDIHGAHQIMDKNIAPSFDTGQPMAKAGIDIALHDLAGKITGQTLAEKWGRNSAKEITISWTLNPKSLDELDSLIQEGWDLGFRNFNVKVAPEPKFDLELCQRVKQRVPEGFLWADANGGYDLATAKKAAPKLADVGVAVLEQPLRINNLSGYRELKQQGALPIIMDEGIVSPTTLIEFIRLDLLDGVAMKPARCGGLLSAKRQIEILLDAGLMFLGSGLTDPDISLAATLALYGAFDYQLPAALNGPQFIKTSALKKPLIPTNGKLEIPTGPGLGIEVDESKIERIMVEI